MIQTSFELLDVSFPWPLLRALGVTALQIRANAVGAWLEDDHSPVIRGLLFPLLEWSFLEGRLAREATYEVALGLPPTTLIAGSTDL